MDDPCCTYVHRAFISPQTEDNLHYLQSCRRRCYGQLDLGGISNTSCTFNTYTENVYCWLGYFCHEIDGGMGLNFSWNCLKILRSIIFIEITLGGIMPETQAGNETTRWLFIIISMIINRVYFFIWLLKPFVRMLLIDVMYQSVRFISPSPLCTRSS